MLRILISTLLWTTAAVSGLAEDTSHRGADHQTGANGEESESATESESPQNKTARGQLMIVGPEGQVHEFAFGPGPHDADVSAAHPSLNRLLNLTADTNPRPMIGVTCRAAGVLLRRHLKLADTGVVVTHVVPDLPADKAGIHPGDILLSINEEKLNDPATLAGLIAASADKELTVQYLRDGETQSTVVTVSSIAPSALPLTAIDRLNATTLKRFGPGMWVQEHDKLDQQLTDLLNQAQASTSNSGTLQQLTDRLLIDMQKLKSRVAELERDNDGAVSKSPRD